MTGDKTMKPATKRIFITGAGLVALGLAVGVGGNVLSMKRGAELMRGTTQATQEDIAAAIDVALVSAGVGLLIGAVGVGLLIWGLVGWRKNRRGHSQSN